MNEMNSLTHSCIHSLASFAIFAFSGRAVFIILATGAKGGNILAGSSFFPAREVPEGSEDGDGGVWDMMGCVTAEQPLDLKLRALGRGTGQFVGHARVVNTTMSLAITSHNEVLYAENTSHSNHRKISSTNHLLLEAIDPALRKRSASYNECLKEKHVPFTSNS